MTPHRQTTAVPPHGGSVRCGVRLAVAVASLTAALFGTALAQGARNDAYQPPADQPTSTLGGGQYPASPPPPYTAPPYGQSSSNGYGQPPSGGYGQNTYGQPQTYGVPRYGSQPGASSGYGGQGAGVPPPANPGYAANGGYGTGPRDDGTPPPRQDGYGQPYSAPPPPEQGPPPYDNRDDGRPTRGYYARGEVEEAGRGFFGSISKGLASAIEYTYQSVGRPNGYILGEDGGGAFFAGLRYGEGMMYTKDAGDQKVFWQGPSLGYDVGGEGSKIMVLVYNMADPGDIYHRFGGVEGSAYLVGGVSVQLQKHDDVTLAVIRSGVGLRLGANVGYLKYTREPTWNPF